MYSLAKCLFNSREMGKADFQKDQTIKDEGFYSVVFVNCEEGNSISFEVGHHILCCAFLILVSLA